MTVTDDPRPADEPAAVEAAVEAFRRQRDEAAFRALYRLTTPRLWAVAVRIADDRAAAEDAVQETWLRAVRGFDGFAGRSRFTTWLTGILLHCLHEHRRAGWREDTDASAPTPVAAPRDRTARLEVGRALARLAPGFRAVLVLHDLHGFTHEEVGTLLGIATGTSKSQLARGRLALRRALRPIAVTPASRSQR